MACNNESNNEKEREKIPAGTHAFFSLPVQNFSAGDDSLQYSPYKTDWIFNNCHVPALAFNCSSNTRITAGSVEIASKPLYFFSREPKFFCPLPPPTQRDIQIFSPIVLRLRASVQKKPPASYVAYVCDTPFYTSCMQLWWLACYFFQVYEGRKTGTTKIPWGYVIQAYTRIALFPLKVQGAYLVAQ